MTDQNATPAKPHIVERLYRVAKRLPCTCEYRRVAGIVYCRPDGSRQLVRKCDRCETVEDYEAMKQSSEETK